MIFKLAIEKAIWMTEDLDDQRCTVKTQSCLKELFLIAQFDVYGQYHKPRWWFIIRIHQKFNKTL